MIRQYQNGPYMVAGLDPNYPGQPRNRKPEIGGKKLVTSPGGKGHQLQAGPPSPEKRRTPYKIGVS